MRRRASALLIIAAMLLSLASLTAPARAATATTAYPTVNLVINGKPVTSDVPAQLIGDRTMVPARAVFETLGADVGWVNSTNTVTVAYLNHNVSVKIGARTATVDGNSIKLDVAPVLIGDRTLVPLRFIAESIGAKVGWIPQPYTATVDLSPAVVGVSWAAGSGHGTLYIDAVGAIHASARKLSDPERIVIDVPGATLQPGDSQDLSNDRNVTGVSTTADAAGVHITLGLAGPTGFNLVQYDDSHIGLEVGYRIAGAAYARDGDNDKVTIRTTGPAAYHLTRLANPNRLVLDFGLSTVLEPADIQVDGAYINDVRVAQYSSDPADARIVLQFKGDAVPVGIKRTSDGYELTVSPQYVAALSGRTIYIDPGHGGTDPGAIGASGTHEADVNLDTAIRLQTLLANAGANAILTRDGDHNVELYSRPYMANDDNADIFVALHNNWYQSASVGGTQVYYYFTNPDSPRLAAAVHDALISELGLQDKGVLTERFAVIRVAEMPSILVETAFLSNPKEDALLKTPEFRQQNAQAVYDGILAYFSQGGTNQQ